jgi:hypothetical protein
MASKIIVDQLEKTGGALTALTLPTGNASAGQVLQNDGSGNLSWAADAGGLFSGYAIFADQKAQNTQGGTFTTGAWRQRDLNTTIANTDTTNITLGTNDFTLLAGNYLIQWSFGVHGVYQNQTQLHDGTSTIAIGTCNYAAETVPATGETRVTPSTSTTYQIQHQCWSTKASDGFGVASNYQTEQYATVLICKES